MKVTEHNITDWELDQSEIKELIYLVKQEIKNHREDKAKELFYGILLGKLLIMRNSETPDELAQGTDQLSYQPV